MPFDFATRDHDEMVFQTKGEFNHYPPTRINQTREDELAFSRFFEFAVDDALATVGRILEVNRNPRLASEVEHEYSNKYELADLMTNIAIISQANCLEQMGLTAEVLKSIDTSKSTTLRFQASDSCSFLKEQTVEVPMESSLATTEKTTSTGTFFGSTTKSTISRVVNHVKEYHWKVDVQWEISIYSGTEVDKKTVLKTRSSSMILVIQSNSMQPRPDHVEHRPHEVSLTWFMKQIDPEARTARFKIDTQDPDTKTPRRNWEVENALDFMESLKNWNRKVCSFFFQNVKREMIDKHNPAGPQPKGYKPIQWSSLTPDTVFLPIQPLLEEPPEKETIETEKTDSKSILSLPTATANTEDDTKPSALLSVNDMHKLLNEQIRSLQEKIDSLQKQYPPKHLVKLISVAEATLLVLCRHSQALSDKFEESIGFIETMLENQLVSAIGKRVKSSDLDQFVKFHNAKLLNLPPQPFCHSIRRPKHYPDGLLAIESKNGDGKMDPINTFVRNVESAPPLKLPLNAATTLTLTGKTFLHGWLQHRFHQNRKSYNLTARARQFSSFILVVGTMLGPDQLEPKDAIIIQNKDELLIPLLLNELPTAKEFKDAIRSLSPDQRRFAEAFRGMQLESSVLGVCVIQIKPQLEELLGLPHDALTKEMKLTQDLMELFVDYQVPSDLLSYDGEDENVNVKEKVSNVKGHVQAVLDVIAAAKIKQLEEATMMADMAFEEAEMDDYEEESGEGMVFAKTSVKSRRSRSSALNRPSRSVSYFGNPPAPAVMMSFAGSAPPPPSEHYDMMMMSPAGSAPPPPSRRSGSMVPVAKPVRTEGSPAGIMPMPSTAEVNPSHKPTKMEHSEGKQEGLVDFTMMPKMLDGVIEKHDKDNALRSTIIKTSNHWTRKRQENLLSKVKATSLPPDEIKMEKEKAFDLLDALSRSGSLSVSCSELHVVISVTHCFEKDVMGTVIQDNMNPIEKLEMSTLLVASLIHGIPAHSLIRDDNEKLRLATSFPAMLGSASESQDDV